MKVLIITPYLYYNNKNQFAVNSTGFGFLLKEIASYLSDIDEVYVLSSVITEECEIDGFTIVSHKWTDVLKNLTIRNLLIGLHDTFSDKLDFKNKIKRIYYAIDSGYTEKTIKKLKPDIVHFHAVGYRTELGVNICERLNQKYVLTLHGLVGLEENTQLHLKTSERKLLEDACEKNIPLTVISTGIKNRIEKYYNLNTTNNINVVTNGTNIEPEKAKPDINIREKYNIPTDGKIMLCIGNISKRKNQEQLIRAFSLLKFETKNNLFILILGNIDESLRLDEMISEQKLDKNIKLCGFIKKEELISYYEAADYNALVSIDEGFGLSMIEAFIYGIPTITFPDLDAVPDIYNEHAMILTKGRSDDELANAIECLVKKSWDKNFIQEHAKKFSLGRMAKEYHEVYLATLEEV